MIDLSLNDCFSYRNVFQKYHHNAWRNCRRPMLALAKVAWNSFNGKFQSDNLVFAKLGQWKSKECKVELEDLLTIFIWSNSKLKVTCKSVVYECRYIRTHTKEKASKIPNINFAILLSNYLHNYQTEWPTWVPWNLQLW